LAVRSAGIDLGLALRQHADRHQFPFLRADARAGAGTGQPRRHHHDAGAGVDRDPGQRLVLRIDEWLAVRWLHADFHGDAGQPLADAALLAQDAWQSLRFRVVERVGDNSVVVLLFHMPAVKKILAFQFVMEQQ